MFTSPFLWAPDMNLPCALEAVSFSTRTAWNINLAKFIAIKDGLGLGLAAAGGIEQNLSC